MGRTAQEGEVMATERRATKRNRASAKAAGAQFEIRAAEHLREALENIYISRQDKNGDKDLGDIAYVGAGQAGVSSARSGRVPITWESKNTASMNLTGAMREAQAEAANFQEKYGGPEPLPVVHHKRHGVAAPGKQWVTMEVDTLIRLLRIAEGLE